MYPFSAFMNDNGIRPCGCWLGFLRLKCEGQGGKLSLSCGSSDVVWISVQAGGGVISDDRGTGGE